MARKKTKHRVHHRRRSSIHGISDSLTRVGTVAAGAVLGAFGNQAIKTALPSLPAWSGGAILLAAGIGLPMFMKGNQMVNGIADGLAAAGGLFILNETFLSVPGISGVPKSYNPGARLVYRNTQKVQRSVGAPGFMDNPINGVKDLNVLGALYDN
jgi:hypothetical protein